MLAISEPIFVEEDDDEEGELETLDIPRAEPPTLRPPPLLLLLFRVGNTHTLTVPSSLVVAKEAIEECAEIPVTARWCAAVSTTR